jgi:hypothetical protein
MSFKITQYNLKGDSLIDMRKPKREFVYEGCRCLLCERDKMYKKLIQDEFEFKGYKFSEPAWVYWCDTCNDGFYAPESDDVIEQKVKKFFDMVQKEREFFKNLKEMNE